MANGSPAPGAAAAIANRGRKAQAFDAGARDSERQDTPAVIAGHTFKRRRKAWKVSRLMRTITRDQETAVALSHRIRVRVAELETEQLEAAAEGKDELEGELEGKIQALITRGDEATEAAELVTYRLLALLLVPAEDAELEGFGPVEDPSDADPAIHLLQEELDVEDAADLARELTGSVEPDPQETPSSETGST